MVERFPRTELLGHKALLPVARFAHFFADFALLRQTTAETIPSELAPRLNILSWSAFLADFRARYEQELRKGTFFNVWEVAGLGRNEVRNAAVLACLLGYNAAHPYGARFLRCLLDQLDPDRIVPFLSPSFWSSGYIVDVETYPRGTENRVDIVLQSHNALILLEVKIDSSEGPNQIGRYLELARTMKRARSLKTAGVIYLTRPIVQLATPYSAELIHATWRQVAQSIERTVAGTDFLGQTLIEFARHIKQF